MPMTQAEIDNAHAEQTHIEKLVDERYRILICPRGGLVNKSQRGDYWREVAIQLQRTLAERDRELQQAREEIARLKESMKKISTSLNSADCGEGINFNLRGLRADIRAALHPVPEKPQS